MSEYKNIKISDYSYNLPGDRIAKYPLTKRDNSKLLIWRNGQIEKDLFNNITHYLPENALLVFNNTRVIHARLLFQKRSGAKIEIFCIEPVEPSDHQLAFRQKNKVIWKCLVGNSRKWKEGTLHKTIKLSGNYIELIARKMYQQDNIHVIEFSWKQEFSFSEIIKRTGILPIPPYLKRKTEPSDETTYQTVYAKWDGSVAAPTAGLHFTESILRRLTEKKIDSCEITLHVGAGTFQPVKSDTIAGHIMHREKVIIPKTIIEKLSTGKHKIIAVGTTSVRSLESLYRLGVKLEKQPDTSESLHISQWEPYEEKASVSIQKALGNILLYLGKTGKETLQFTTQIIIVPGYDFKLTEGMITNFHQPQSTLLLLIGAFLGNDWEKVYNFALTNKFRFLSYGDSNLYLK